MWSANTWTNGRSDGDRGLRPRGAYREDLRGFGRGGPRRVDESGGDAPLVPLRARLGDAAGRGRSPGGRRSPGIDATARRHRSWSARRVHADRPATPAGDDLDLR